MQENDMGFVQSAVTQTTCESGTPAPDPPAQDIRANHPHPESASYILLPHTQPLPPRKNTGTMILTGPPYGPVSTLWLHKQTIQPKHNTISSKMLLDLLLNTNERELNS